MDKYRTYHEYIRAYIPIVLLWGVLGDKTIIVTAQAGNNCSIVVIFVYFSIGDDFKNLFYYFKY